MIGYIGAVILLTGYGLFSFKKIDLQVYHLCNFMSCTLLAINAYQLGSIPFLLTNIAFATIGIIEFFRYKD